jgi:hypothetical protein
VRKLVSTWICISSALVLALSIAEVGGAATARTTTAPSFVVSKGFSGVGAVQLKWTPLGPGWKYTVSSEVAGDGCPTTSQTFCLATVSKPPTELLTITARSALGVTVVRTLMISVRLIVIIAGQSNAQGHSSFALDQYTETNFLIQPNSASADRATSLTWLPWNVLPQPASQSGMVPLNTPQLLNDGSSFSGQAIFGPELGLGRKFFAKTGFGLTIVKAAFGGTSLAADWAVTANNRLVPPLIARVKKILAADAITGKVDLFGGFVWFQGEADALNAKYAAQYQANLGTFVDELRSQLHFSTTTPTVILEESLAQFIAVRSSAGQCDQCSQLRVNDDLVRSADEAFVAAHANSCLLDSKGLARTSNGVHLLNMAETALGAAAADCLTKQLSLPPSR